MLRHLLRLTWKRKSRNLMLSLEILLAFVIVFGIAASSLRYWQLYRLPLGFDDADTWSVMMQMGAPPDANPDAIPADVYDMLRRSLRELPEVRAVSFATFPPYSNFLWTIDYQQPQTKNLVELHVIEASDDLPDTLGMKLTAGRWFSAADDGQDALPAVLDTRAAAALFPGRPALGQRFTDINQGPTHTFRVIGLMDTFRDQGPLTVPASFVMTRFTPHATQSRPRTILLRVAPGTPRGFEAKLNQRLKAVRNDWGYRIATLTSMRASLLRGQLYPLTVMTVIASFMLVMVAFGLFGVLWQNTTRRIPEIGLRRAIGARAGDIYRQIIAEQLLICSFAMAVGLVLLVQLPLTGAFADTLNWPVFAGAAALSMAVIYLLSFVCSLYPGWRASRLDPAAALHYE
jgi:putative ABC transport system permease protein